jgi:hypothetical protein
LQTNIILAATKIKTHMKTLIFFTLSLFSSFVFAQTGNVGIGTTTPNANAIIDIKSNTKGVLLPRMDSVSRKAIPNVQGLLVYDSTYSSYYFNTGTAWQKLGGTTGVQIVANGTNPGDMLYWNGTTWAIAAAGKPGQYLQFDSTKKPLWSGDQNASISTLAATDITDSSASLNINLISSGIQAATVNNINQDLEKGICWGLSPNPTATNYYYNGVGNNNNFWEDTASAPGAYTYSIGTYTLGNYRLLVNTTYYIRAFASNDAGTVYGNQVTFKTLNGPISLPTVAVGYADSLFTTAVFFIYNTVVNNGGGAITARGMVWSSTTATPTLANSKTIDGSGDGYFGSKLTGLSPNTTYYYSVYATNSAGTAYSDVNSFTTNP